MKRIPLLLVALFVLSLSSAAVAADYALWVPSLDEARKQAKERGAMIFIAMFVEDEPDNVAQVHEYMNPSFVKASRDFVCLMACPSPGWGSVTVEVDGRKVRRCRIAPTINNEDLVTAWAALRTNYANLNTDSTGGVRIPFHFVIDADGKVLGTIANGSVEGGFGAMPADAMVSQMSALVRQHGRGLAADDYEEMKSALAGAEAKRKAGDNPAALKLLKKIISKAGKSRLADQARALQLTISEDGAAEIEEVLAGVSKDPVGAILALEEIADDYDGTDVARRANKEIAELKKDPEVKAALAGLALRKASEKEFKKVESAVAAGQYAKALAMLDKLANKYRGNPVGERAAARADELRSDPKIAAEAMEQAAEKYCRGWLSMGRSFAKNGMADQARVQFQKVIDKFPGTSYAKEAEKEIAKLK